ncbi:toxin-antitoxin system YwqK family antitoxin [Fibrella sp. WM1]|uniref:toxin-antitoxin system YwqK family antitoxin n=1 Tax=Fibrella musci TaxID=3242485 RepID=UPI0035228DD5
MARQAPLRDSGLVAWLIALLALGLPGCGAEPSIPHVFVNSAAAGWQWRDGQLWLNNNRFSGWQYSLYPTGDTAFVGAYWQGKAEGVHRKRYANGQLREWRHYRHGWQEGEQRGWYANGKPEFTAQCQHDVYEGKLNEWFPNGRLARRGTYHEGHEEGPQQLWFDNGTLKANYEAREGRLYGFTGVKNCENVWDSIRVAP